ncbi:ABC transporter permease subunit [Hydrogenophaga sp. 5NK40-0174]|uniref:amino acid ABC transporter permease n=1 Tax=Hydrogenophaga sp. 5NK40-0174 TaxID=3127649 RepID=UPI003102E6B8
MSTQSPPRHKHQWSLNSKATRGVIFQVLLVLGIALAVWFLSHNTQRNMERLGMQSGFDFLTANAGFDIGEKPVEYSPTDSYGKAIWIGVLNTLKVAVTGIILTTILGVSLGVGRFSRNVLVRGLCYGYVEAFRNVPLLLQLLMWYIVYLNILPETFEPMNFGDIAFLSKGGLAYPFPTEGVGQVLLGAIGGVIAGVFWRRHVQKTFEATGKNGDRVWTPIALVVAGALVGWVIAGAPTKWDVPVHEGFLMEGGARITPEFLTLLTGLVCYTSAFVAEVVRGGIQSVSRGQEEAAMALGLTQGQKMNLVVLPQAMRVIIPSLTNQYLNLTKNSSLAVAIGYPDVVSIAQTTINQSGRAVECVAIIMLVYLSTSLTTSGIMNWYNSRMAIKER